MNAGRYSPSFIVKKRGRHSSPISSRSRVASRWASSISVLASVAASRSLALIAAVTLLQSLSSKPVSKPVSSASARERNGRTSATRS